MSLISKGIHAAYVRLEEMLAKNIIAHTQALANGDKIKEAGAEQALLDLIQLRYEMHMIMIELLPTPEDRLNFICAPLEGVADKEAFFVSVDKLVRNPRYAIAGEVIRRILMLRRHSL